jgi:flavin-binding protein dodecin
MAVLKVIEVLSNSTKSFEDAIEKAVKKADKTLKNIRSVNVQNMSVTVDGGKIKEYRVNLHLSFELE